MTILKIWQKQPFDIIAMTPRGTLGLCCVHIAQLVTHPAVYTLPFTLQLCYKPLGILQRVTKSQKVHISSHDVLQKLHYIDFAWYRSEVFSDRGWKNRNFFLHPLFVLRTIKNALPGIWELSREKAGFPISRVIVDIPAVIKVFKFC